ncbi:hypothetical protein F5Y03DRAFT_393389 [Xylaria venustula]|nr:hypothetical protein F5Y03DRAFT_393389 [Xylaria venustula]
MSSDTGKPVEPAHTPYPYHAGQSLTLKDSNGTEFSAHIIYEYPLTISPVVVVNFHKHGVVHEAVLKLCDRRFEAAFQEVSRNGMLTPILDDLKDADLMWDLYNQVVQRTDEEDEEEKRKPERERFVKEEVEFYYKIRKRYDREVRVYDRLKSLQGRGIPRLFTTVLLQMPSAPLDLQPGFFQVPGILIEKINGFNLTDLVTKMPRAPPELWAHIIQKAINLIVEINRAGILDEDSQPRNALVTRREDAKFQVYRIDFGEAGIESDVTFRRDDNPDFFKQCAASANNPYALGGVMVSKIKRLTGIKLNVVFDQIFPGVDGLPSPE